MNDLENVFGAYENFIYRIKTPTNALVGSIGINDSPFVVKPTINGKRITHPAYETWHSMIRRCYVEGSPTYIDIEVCKEWLIFSNFAIWFKNNYIKGFQLDKDLLIKNNKIYSKDTCLFIPAYINSFLTTRALDRGPYPLGVSKSIGSNGYTARISDNSGGRIYLGYSENPMEAHKLWQLAKLKQAIEYEYKPLQRIIDQLSFEIENNLETKTL